MPSLIGTTVTANYLRTFPSSQFGTRALRFVKVVVSGGSSNDLTKGADGATGAFTDSNSLFSRAVRAIQNSVELYFVGTPSATAFVIAISDDTANDSDVGSNVEDASYGDIEAYVAAAVGSGTVTMTTLAASGASIA